MSGISPEQKKDPKEKKRGSKDWKEKEVKAQLKSSMFWEKKRKRGWNLQAAGRDYQKKERKEITILL
jgi:hypothetical protein